MTRGQTLIEVLIVVGLIAMVLVPLVTLSTRNLGDHQDIMERALAQGLCLDTLERFKKYKPIWPMPGMPPKPPLNIPGPPLYEMYGAVDLRPGKLGIFDRVYLDQMRALGIAPQPRIQTTPDPEVYGLFNLEVSVSWKSRSGQQRQVKFSRICFAP